MILLDTDHLTLLSFPGSARYGVLTARMRAAHDQEEEGRKWREKERERARRQFAKRRRPKT